MRCIDLSDIFRYDTVTIITITVFKKKYVTEFVQTALSLVVAQNGFAVVVVSLELFIVAVTDAATRHGLCILTFAVVRVSIRRPRRILC